MSSEDVIIKLFGVFFNISRMLCYIKYIIIKPKSFTPVLIGQYSSEPLGYAVPAESVQQCGPCVW